MGQAIGWGMLNPYSVRKMIIIDFVRKIIIASVEICCKTNH